MGHHPVCVQWYSPPARFGGCGWPHFLHLSCQAEAKEQVVSKTVD